MKKRTYVRRDRSIVKIQLHETPTISMVYEGEKIELKPQEKKNSGK